MGEDKKQTIGEFTISLKPVEIWQPTAFFRWVELGNSMKLQQKWWCSTGTEEWKDIPVVSQEEFEKEQSG